MNLGDDNVWDPRQSRSRTARARLHIDQDSGVSQIDDRKGNSLSVTPEGVFSSLGPSVPFVRDAQGQITTITDPNGKVLSYAYDDEGDLAASTDRAANTTNYAYAADHYLDEVMDPLGRHPIRCDYDDSGRLLERSTPSATRRRSRRTCCEPAAAGRPTRAGDDVHVQPEWGHHAEGRPDGGGLELHDGLVREHPHVHRSARERHDVERTTARTTPRRGRIRSASRPRTRTTAGARTSRPPILSVTRRRTRTTRRRATSSAPRTPSGTRRRTPTTNRRPDVDDRSARKRDDVRLGFGRAHDVADRTTQERDQLHV